MIDDTDSGENGPAEDCSSVKAEGESKFSMLSQGSSVPMEVDPSAKSEEEASAGPLGSFQGKLSKLSAMAWETYRRKPMSYWILLFISSGLMLVAFPASSLLSRLYYADGGKSKWIISWVAVAGWPLTALFLAPMYFLASTASLLAASSLVFSAVFGYFLVGNKLNSDSINAIVIITAAMVIIGLDSASDRYSNVSNRQYILGFIWDILGSALHGLIFALSELVFVKLLGRRSFHVVLEQQVMVSLIGFVFTTIGVVANRDFPEMKKEARSFKHGEGSYYMVLIWAAISFQLGVLGGTAVLYLASTVLAGVLNAVRVPLTSIAAVVLFHDPMSGFKILSLIITFWGFGSYMYGESTLRKGCTS
ncbi:probable purine permease 5 isoform X3 [Macadamia integrifolia]|uniref:probable purine permease 5 isoform X3 n=1 Tax=Macadamia integrifolia TaxID=60698 RepID=UPI001C4E43B9|nr:probable purine permease 5 isoform X3 [Macadamia integrifolia]